MFLTALARSLTATIVAVAAAAGWADGYNQTGLVTIPTIPLEQVTGSPEWATVIRNRNGHRLVSLRATETATEGQTAAPAPPATPPPPPEPPPAPPPPGVIVWRPEVERWRSLVAVYFNPADVDHALAIIRCESVGDPDAYNPAGPVSGLFQHRDRYWPSRSATAGWAGADIFDPEANTAVAAWLVYHNGGWQHWSGLAWGADSCEEWAQAQGVG